MSKEEKAANNTNMLSVYSANVAKFGYGPYFACKTIAEFPVTDPANMDAWNMQAIARHAIKDAIEPPAIANKAAEEGEIPVVSWVDRESLYQTPEFSQIERMEAEIADWRAYYRASRQVANKAEVDLDAGFLQWVHDRLRFVHGENENVDYMHKLRAIIASVPTGRNTPNVASIATPPATTGASTAREAILEEVAKAVECLLEMGASTDVVYDEGFDHGVKTAAENIRCLIRHPCGASTVLTDERIEALREYANPKNWTLDSEGIARIWLEPGSSTPDCYAGFELASHALAAPEVAAQAGQVAVPEAVRVLREAIQKQLAPDWECNSNHPALFVALKATGGLAAPAKEPK